MTRPTFQNLLPTAIQDVTLSGTSHTLTAGERALLLTNSQMVMDLEVEVTTDTYSQTTGAWLFELTSSSAGSIGLAWGPSGSPAGSNSTWTLAVGGVSVIVAHDQQYAVGLNNSGAAPAAGQRLRVLVALMPDVGLAVLQFTVNGVMSTAITAAFSTALGTITAGSIGRKLDTTLPYASTLARLRSHHYVVATAAWLPQWIDLGDSIQSTIATGQGPAPATLVYSAAEAAAMDLPKGLCLAVPGDTIGQQATRLAARYDGTVVAVMCIAGINNIMASGHNASQMLTAATALVTAARAAIASVKVALGYVTPARTYALIGDTLWAEAVGYNAGLTGCGADTVMTSHFAPLDDGTGALKTAADSGDHIHPRLGPPGRTDIASTKRATLSSLGAL